MMHLVVLSYLKAISRHTVLVLHDKTLTLLLRVVRLREQHAFVSGGFLGLADATWLQVESASGTMKKVNEYSSQTQQAVR